MLLSLVYFVLRRLLSAMSRSGRSDLEREVELPGPAASGQGALEGCSSATTPHAGPYAARRGEPDSAKRALEGVRRDPSHPASVAPAAHPPQVDISGPQAGPTTARSGDDRAHHSAGEREPSVGLPEDPGRALKLGIRASATAIRTVIRRLGLGPAPRRSGPSWSEFLRAQAHGPRLGVGDPAGSEPGSGGAPSRSAIPDPGPRLEILRPIRRGLPHRRREDRQDADPGTQGERVRRAMGENGSPGVPGSSLDPRPRPPGANPSGVPQPLQRGEAPPGIAPRLSFNSGVIRISR